MARVDRREMARRLRTEAERIRKCGLSNFSEHTYACLMYGQASKPRLPMDFVRRGRGKPPEQERCGDCPNRSFVQPEFADEAFPCQHITEENWGRAVIEPGQAERTAEWLLRMADLLEAKAESRKTN